MYNLSAFNWGLIFLLITNIEDAVIKHVLPEKEGETGGETFQGKAVLKLHKVLFEGGTKESQSHHNGPPTVKRALLG